jgi:hypothetical protein
MDKDLKKDILFFLDNQNNMYDLTLNHPNCNYAQRKGILVLKKKLDKIIDQLKNGES